MKAADQKSTLPVDEGSPLEKLEQKETSGSQPPELCSGKSLDVKVRSDGIMVGHYLVLACVVVIINSIAFSSVFSISLGRKWVSYMFTVLLK